jgi:hypothetical protein
MVGGLEPTAISVLDGCVAHVVHSPDWPLTLPPVISGVAATTACSCLLLRCECLPLLLPAMLYLRSIAARFAQLGYVAARLLGALRSHQH